MTTRPMRVSDLPIVYLSYDEPWAEEFFADLAAKFPGAKRVHGVKGLDACHKAAAEEAGTEWFITVDADTLVAPAFADAEIPEFFVNQRTRIDWPSRNVVNGLAYGNGSLKCWPRAMVLSMQTHEAAPAGTRSLDHDVGRGLASNPTSFGIQLPQAYSTTHPAETAYHAFRCGYREGLRVSLPPSPADLGRGFATHLHDRRRARLQAWCSIGTHATNGIWMIYGARMGVLASQLGGLDLDRINDFAWFNDLWDNLISQRFAGQSGHCPRSGFTWDTDHLEAEVRALGKRLALELDLEVLHLSSEHSAMLASSERPEGAAHSIDLMGNAYQSGQGVDKDPERALACFEIGKILNLSNSFNNFARMFHKGRGVPQDIERARENYEMAVALENKYAPSHLARLIGEFDDRTPEVAARIRMLDKLSAERGFVAPSPGTPAE
ncbi:hypothetical protein [Ostreiculturibacter nitratireducens]|uniref:tetratricopeptide repeat protein n=1 Tax=Ostreiculturibacter nitratireducens TaxID=3075226 RepID=UPI0031B63972